MFQTEIWLSPCAHYVTSSKISRFQFYSIVCHHVFVTKFLYINNKADFSCAVQISKLDFLLGVAFECCNCHFGVPFTENQPVETKNKQKKIKLMMPKFCSSKSHTWEKMDDLEHFLLHWKSYFKANFYVLFTSLENWKNDNFTTVWL